MKVFLYTGLIFLLVLPSCRTARPVTTNDTATVVTAEAKKPAWVSKRPIDYRYYIGIGVASKKNQLNYQQLAKKSAMEDLVSEIKVKIEGASMLHQIDQNDKFREMYQSHVKTIISESIEGFELVDSWEDENEYWVYYRLSRESYEYEKKIKKEAAIKSAQDLLVRGNADQESGLVSNAIDNYVQAIQILYEKDGLSHDPILENEIIATLNRLLSRISIKFQVRELKVIRGFYEPTVVPAIITYTSESDKEFKAINLMIKGFFENEKEETYLTSDENGTVYFSLASFKSNASQVLFKAQLAGTKLTFKNTALGQLINRSAPIVNLTVKLSTPSVFLDYPLNDKVAGEYLKKWFIDKKFNMVKDSKTADLICTIECEERYSVLSELYTTYLTANIRLYASENNKEKLILRMDEVKGVHLNKETSRNEAVKKLGGSIESLLYPKLSEYFMF
ncbi:MAG TPA: LPP20 family lipoprotein [Cytophagaceae bacterium]